jgi:ferrous iron transport protein B
MVRQSTSSNSPLKSESSPQDAQSGGPRNATVALIGNPNTGKSSLFNALCGANARVGNYAGVTVEHKSGRLQIGDRLNAPIGVQWQVEVVDLPGTYSLAARSADEAVSVEVLAGEMPGVPKPDAVIVILDSTNLERNLYLLSQVLELRIPVIAVLNMWDRIDAEGVRIDPSKLSKSIGVPVVCTSASNRTGIDELKSQLLEMLDRKNPALGLPDPASLASGCFPEVFGKSVDGLLDWFASQGIALNRFQVERLLIDDPQGHSFRVVAKDQASTVQTKIGEVRDALKSQGLSIPLFETRCRYGWIKSRLEGVIERESRTRQHSASDKIDRWLTHRWVGLLFFLVLMFLLFQSITLVADWPMKMIEHVQGVLGAWIEKFVG